MQLTLSASEIPKHLLRFFEPVSNLRPKDLCMIPARVALALQADGWYLRAEIVWAKPNPMPESVTDRPTKAHEYIFLLTKEPTYFWDAEAVREGLQPSSVERSKHAWNGKSVVDPDGKERRAQPDTTDRMGERWAPAAGRNLRSVWTIPTSSSNWEYCKACDTLFVGKERKAIRKEQVGDTIIRHCTCGATGGWVSHFAAWPPALVERMIRAGTSERGCCPKCLAPWARVVEKVERPIQPLSNVRETPQGTHKAIGHKYNEWLQNNPDKTIGWQPTCECAAHAVLGAVPKPKPTQGEWIETIKATGPEWAPIPCTVLDIFVGSGTTGRVALALGRSFIGIDLNPDYCAVTEAWMRRVAGSEPEPVPLSEGATQLPLMGGLP